MFFLYRDPLLSNTSNQSIRKTTLQEISFEELKEKLESEENWPKDTLKVYGENKMKDTNDEKHDEVQETIFHLDLLEILMIVVRMKNTSTWSAASCYRRSKTERETTLCMI